LDNPVVLHHIGGIGELEAGTHILLDDEHRHVRCALRSGDSAVECPELEAQQTEFAMRRTAAYSQ
jgi:hypothetical protein